MQESCFRFQLRRLFVGSNINISNLVDCRRFDLSNQDILFHGVFRSLALHIKTAGSLAIFVMGQAMVDHIPSQVRRT